MRFQLSFDKTARTANTSYAPLWGFSEIGSFSLLIKSGVCGRVGEGRVCHASHLTNAPKPTTTA